LIIFMGTIVLNKLMFLSMLGVGNLQIGGSAATASGAILLVKI